MADMSFEDILNQPGDEIKAPVALPIGSYLAIVEGQPEYMKIGQNNTDCVNFQLKPIKALRVDPNQLAESLNGAQLSDKRIRLRLFITNDSKWRLIRFLHDHLGIPKSGVTVRQMVSEAMGRQVVIELGHEPARDGSTIYHTVKDTANADEAMAKMSS